MNYYKFQSSFAVDGSCRSVIYDTNRNDYTIVKKEVAKFLRNDKIFPISHKDYLKLKTDLQEIVNFLMDEEHLFLLERSDLINSFSSISLEFKSPFKFKYGTVLYRSQDSIDDINNVFAVLNKLNCIRLSLICFSSISMDDISKILEIAGENGIARLELQLQEPYGIRNLVDSLESLYMKFGNLSKIVFHTSSHNYKDEQLPVYWIKSSLKDSLNERQVDPSHFKVNLELFKEAKKHNVHYNQRLIIDCEGNIYEDYRFIPTQWTLSSVNEYFKNGTNLWRITKDQIEGCKDCEFRYMCQDTAVPIKQDNNVYKRERKCNYDPKTTKWEAE